MDLSNIKYIISDWDGTLVDSMPIYTRTYSTVLQSKYGIDPKKSGEYFNGEGGGRALSFQLKQAVRKFAGKDVDSTQELELMFWKMLENETPNLVPGAFEFLKELQKRGFHIISWSGSPGEKNRETAKKLGVEGFFDLIVGSELGSGVFVKGETLFKKIADNFGKKPEEIASQTLVIGDMIGDIEAGREIGAITCGFGDPKDPKFKDADFVVKSHQELLDKLSV